MAVNTDGNMPYDICDDEICLEYIESEMAAKGVTQQTIDLKRSETEMKMLEDLKQIYMQQLHFISPVSNKSNKNQLNTNSSNTNSQAWVRPIQILPLYASFFFALCNAIEEKVLLLKIKRQFFVFV